MYSSIFILVICTCASSTFGHRNYFEGLERCFMGTKNESECDYWKLKYEVSYNLFTSENGHFLDLNDRNLSKCPDSSKPVKIIIHGWMSNAFKPWIQNMNNAYFHKGDYNVITVDWSAPAKKFYYTSVANTLCVGNIISEFVVEYLGDCKISPKDVHIIGHSLGAHVAGFVGKYVTHRTQTKISRISGLDPAGLCFAETGPNNRLYKGDAEIVDVYHTDDNLGCRDAVGDYDFYVNGGLSPQPGCENHILEGFHNIIQGVFRCSHTRSTEYYTESINSIKFNAVKCKYDNGQIQRIVVIMGEDLTTESPFGSYCIRTNSEAPYALSLDGLF